MGIDCLTECERIGSCCKSMVLWTNHRSQTFPVSRDIHTARTEITGMGFPFEITAEATTMDPDSGQPTGNLCWVLGCKALMDDGLCGIYDNRPEVCSTFRAGKDPLCIKHPDHIAAKRRFETSIIRTIGAD